jgi:hypothetical protein
MNCETGPQVIKRVDGLPPQAIRQCVEKYIGNNVFAKVSFKLFLSGSAKGSSRTLWRVG